MIGKRNNVRRTKYEKDLTIVIIINSIGGLVLLAGSVLTIAFEIGIETPIEKYLMCAFILFSILLIVRAVCRQFKHRNDLYDEYEKNLNEIMGEIEKMIKTILVGVSRMKYVTLSIIVLVIMSVVMGLLLYMCAINTGDRTIDDREQLKYLRKLAEKRRK